MHMMNVTVNTEIQSSYNIAQQEDKVNFICWLLTETQFLCQRIHIVDFQPGLRSTGKTTYKNISVFILINDLLLIIFFTKTNIKDPRLFKVYRQPPAKQCFLAKINHTDICISSLICSFVGHYTLYTLIYGSRQNPVLSTVSFELK